MWDFLCAALTAALGSLLLFLPHVPLSREIRLTVSPARQPAVHSQPAGPGPQVPSGGHARSGSGATEGPAHAP